MIKQGAANIAKSLWNLDFKNAINSTIGTVGILAKEIGEDVGLNSYVPQNEKLSKSDMKLL